MRFAALLSVILIGTSAAAARAADHITYAFGGPAHQLVDTIGYADCITSNAPQKMLRGQMARGVSGDSPTDREAEIRGEEAFLHEPVPQESLFKSGELFLFNSPPSVNEGPAGSEPERMRGTFDGILLAI
jgi:hypothetical protein